MHTLGKVALFLFSLSALADAASKPHSVVFGKSATVKAFVGEDETTPVELKIRPLLIDGRVKELTTGPSHEVTDRLFVVQRAYRLNDTLPQESGPSRWRWERGAWLLVNRVTGKVQTVTLPMFDAFHSPVTWFRDYAAYCGLSDDKRKTFTVVAQLGKRKALFTKAVGEKSDAEPTAPCRTPSWSRGPARVTFDVQGEPKFTFTVRSQAVDLAGDQEDEGGD